MLARQVDIPLVTQVEYLDYEAASEFHYEFHDGQILALSGGMCTYDLISRINRSSLNHQLARRRYDTYTSEMGVRSGSKKHYYMDVSALSGTEEFTAGTHPSLLNSTLIVEMLSDSPEVFDLGLKFHRYNTTDQREILAKKHTHLPFSDWKQHTATNFNAAIGSRGWASGWGSETTISVHSTIPMRHQRMHNSESHD